MTNEESSAMRTHLLSRVKIKEEKADPEVEQKIKAIVVNIKKETISDKDDSSQDDGDVANGDADAEDKKSIRPVKSSNEILAELFKVFNAAPPAELLKNNTLPKKNRKQKKSKKDKKSKKHGTTSELSELSNTEGGELHTNDSARKHKHKKKKKHKHKIAKEKEKLKNKDFEKLREKHGSKEKSRDETLDLSKEKAVKRTPQPNITGDHQLQWTNKINGRSCTDYEGTTEKSFGKRSYDNDECSADSLDRKNSFYNGYTMDHRNQDIERKQGVFSSHNSSRKKIQENVGHISDISLSDEETYLKEREQIKNTERQRCAEDKISSRANNTFYIGDERISRNEHYRERYYKSSRRKRARTFSRSRSRTRSRSRSLGIDKKRLLEIARKNAISMFKRGNLPGSDKMSEEIKDKVLLKMRYGGRTVQDLTDFCKKISNGDHFSGLSSDEDSDVDKSGKIKAFHHPFQLKEREPIVMHIRNSTPVVPRKTEDQTKAITMQFPVSSGQHHRMTEGWVPVETIKERLQPLPPLPPAVQSTNIFKTETNIRNMSKNVFEKIVPQHEQRPAFRPLGLPATICEDTAVKCASVENVVTNSVTLQTNTSVSPPPVPPSDAPVPPMVCKETHVRFVPDVPIPSCTSNSGDSNFFEGPRMDVSTIITKRLHAMRRLQENPLDSEAIKMMYNSQRDMSAWALSQHLPGQFVGTTGASVLKVEELHSGPQIWTRRDQLISTRPLTGGIGMHLLQKMGWKPGEGLGREKTGSLQPLLLDVKLDKRGLVAKNDNMQHLQPYKKQRGNNAVQALQNIEDKHPVCILHDIASKNKWMPPQYSLVNESGPSHSKMFLFAVSINGQTFTPERGSNKKKDAKLLAARFCLQQLGILKS